MKNILLILSIGIISTTVTAHAPVKINFHTRINGSDLQYNSNYTVNGTNINVSYLAYYITNIRFVENNNTETALDTVLLVKAGQPSSVTIELATGNYTALKFNVGIADSAINHGDPSAYPASHPLALQNPSMHWSWATGYIFLRLDGLVDTSANQSAGAHEAMRFHLGTLSLVRSVNLSLNNYAIDGSHQQHNEYEANVVFNLEDLFNGIDLRQNYFTMTMGNMPLATSAANNLPNSFEVSIQKTTNITEQNIFAGYVDLFPNPATNQLHVSIQHADLQKGNLLILDINGKEQKSVRIDDSKLTIDISDLPKGMYIIRHSAEGDSSKKMWVY